MILILFDNTAFYDNTINTLSYIMKNLFTSLLFCVLDQLVRFILSAIYQLFHNLCKKGQTKKKPILNIKPFSMWRVSVYRYQRIVWDQRKIQNLVFPFVFVGVKRSWPPQNYIHRVEQLFVYIKSLSYTHTYTHTQPNERSLCNINRKNESRNFYNFLALKLSCYLSAWMIFLYISADLSFPRIYV